MARDYKHRVQPRGRKPPVAGWIWFVAGLLVGVFGTGLAWLELGSVEEADGWIGAQPQEESHPPAKDRGGKPPKPKFDFYTLLPEMEVIVPDDELEPVDPEPPPKVETTPPARNSVGEQAGSERYLIQVASFRKPADAERLEAQLALLGFEAHVQRARGSDGVWHRVRAGPFGSVAEVRAARSRLASNGLKGYVVRLR